MRPLPLLSLLLLACGADLAPPRILELSPSSMMASDARQVTLRIDGVLPYEIDYGASSASVDTDLRVTIGTEALDAAPYRADGTVAVFVPSAFQPGDHAVTARFADGRQATVAALFEVTPGDWPSEYAIAPVDGPFRAGVPFEIRVDALRDGVPFPTFHGTVALSLQDGSPLSPTRTDPFSAAGVTERRVIISTPGLHALVVRDANGTTAVSNTFAVLP